MPSRNGALQSAIALILAAFLAPHNCNAQDQVNPADIVIEAGLNAHTMTDVSNVRINTQGRRPYAASSAAPVGHLSARAKAQLLGLRELKVDTELNCLIARPTETHVFQNYTDNLLEGMFTFPVAP